MCVFVSETLRKRDVFLRWYSGIDICEGDKRADSRRMVYEWVSSDHVCASACAMNQKDGILCIQDVLGD